MNHTVVRLNHAIIKRIRWLLNKSILLSGWSFLLATSKKYRKSRSCDYGTLQLVINAKWFPSTWNVVLWPRRERYGRLLQHNILQYIMDHSAPCPRLLQYWVVVKQLVVCQRLSAFVYNIIEITNILYIINTVDYTVGKLTVEKSFWQLMDLNLPQQKLW